MKERPILFSGPMVRAILEGRKTMTRRVMKPQPELKPGLMIGPTGKRIDTAYWYWKDEWWWQDPQASTITFCPHGQPLDRLWVKETWAKDIPGCPNRVTYRADHLDPKGDGPASPITWRPSIFMPHWASRLTLEITALKVERVQDISEVDARAEGADKPFSVNRPGTYRAGFAYLWDRINGKRPGCSWSDNPWVFVIAFERVTE